MTNLVLRSGDKFWVVSKEFVQQKTGKTNESLCNSGTRSFKVFLNDEMYQNYLDVELTVASVTWDNSRNAYTYYVKENKWQWSEDMIDWKRTEYYHKKQVRIRDKLSPKIEFNENLL